MFASHSIARGLILAGVFSLVTSAQEPSDRRFFRRIVTYPQAEIVPHAATKLDCENKACLPFVQVTVEGHPGNFVLDTGSSHTVISPAFARKCGIEDRKIFHPIEGNIQHRDATFYFVEELRFARSSFRRFHLLSHDLQHLQDGLEKPIDGILGANVLLSAPFSLSLADQTFGFIEAAELDDYPSVNFQLNTLRLQIEVYLEQQRIPMIIDSGASRTMLARTLWKGPHERLAGETQIDINTDDTPDFDHFAVPREVYIGGTDASGLRFKISDDSLLGVDFLTRFTILVNPRERRIAFKEEPPVPPPPREEPEPSE